MSHRTRSRRRARSRRKPEPRDHADVMLDHPPAQRSDRETRSVLRILNELTMAERRAG